jgi:acyl-coenzyme A thioesterase PaaI-like protein
VGTVTKPGKRVAYAAAEIRDGRDKVVATATSSLLIIAPGPVIPD